MIVVCVHVHIKPEHVDQFIQATGDNHRNTILEAGALRFDVLRQADDPARFVLYEVYRDQAAVDAHKTTDHYAKWRDTVADWMAEPRHGVKHEALFPADAEAWKTVK